MEDHLQLTLDIIYIISHPMVLTLSQVNSHCARPTGSTIITQSRHHKVSGFNSLVHSNREPLNLVKQNLNLVKQNSQTSAPVENWKCCYDYLLQRGQGDGKLLLENFFFTRHQRSQRYYILKFPINPNFSFCFN